MKIGLLGFGSMGKTHAYCVRNLPYFFDGVINAEITSVCTGNSENAEYYAKRYSIASYTDDEDDIIYGDTDAVDICTPNICHYESARKAIEAGKHVYCEKPLAVTYAQAKELASLARSKGVVAQVVFNNRFLAPVMSAKEIIEGGRIGKILSFNARYLHSSALDTSKKAGWKQNKDICGGGVLFDLGSHAVDMIYYLCGEFSEVIGKSQIAYPVRCGSDGKEWRTNADEAFYMIATLKCGAQGIIEVSKITTGANDDFTFEVHGDAGSLRFDLMEPNFLYVYLNERQDGAFGGDRGYTKTECVNRYPYPAGVFPGQKAPVGWLRGHIGSYYSFVDAVKTGKEPSPSFDDGAYVQKILECAYRSDKERTAVIIPND